MIEKLSTLESSTSTTPSTFELKFPKHDGNPRPIYFEDITPELRGFLEKRNYVPVVLATLPRNTPEEEIKYLQYKAQGVEEGTVTASAAQLRVLELQMKAAGMLDTNKAKKDPPAKVDKDNVEKILDWGSSRHTLRGNSTVIDITSRKS